MHETQKLRHRQVEESANPSLGLLLPVYHITSHPPLFCSLSSLRRSYRKNVSGSEWRERMAFSLPVPSHPLLRPPTLLLAPMAACMYTCKPFLPSDGQFLKSLTSIRPFLRLVERFNEHVQIIMEWRVHKRERQYENRRRAWAATSTDQTNTGVTTNHMGVYVFHTHHHLPCPTGRGSAGSRYPRLSQLPCNLNPSVNTVARAK